MLRSFAHLLLALLTSGVLAGASGCRQVQQHTRFGFGFGAGPGLSATQAVTSSVAARAAGGCFSDCRAGTRCVPATGLCEPIPDAPAVELHLVTSSPDAGTVAPVETGPVTN